MNTKLVFFLFNFDAVCLISIFVLIFFVIRLCIDINSKSLLLQVFKELDLTPYDLSVDRLDVHAVSDFLTTDAIYMY